MNLHRVHRFICPGPLALAVAMLGIDEACSPPDPGAPPLAAEAAMMALIAIPSGKSATPDSDSLAHAIASDAGCEAEIYFDYAEQLAATLEQLSAEQRHRVLAKG